MNMLAGFVKRAVTSSALVLMALAQFAGPRLASADVYIPLFSQAPNWALGSPQFVALGGCSELDGIPGTCGGLSDRLSLQVLTRPAVSGILTEAGEARPPVIFRVGAGGAVDITIPNANWVFPATYLWRDGPLETVASDGLWLFNTRTTAHAWLGSGISDLDGSALPGDADIKDLYSDAILATQTIDITSVIDPTTGNFTVPNPPDIQTPEPSSIPILLLLTGVSGVTLVARRQRGKLNG